MERSCRSHGSWTVSEIGQNREKTLGTERPPVHSIPNNHRINSLVFLFEDTTA